MFLRVNPTPTELETLRECGRIASKARNWAGKEIKPGYLLRELQEGMETIIRESGALPPFPAKNILLLFFRAFSQIQKKVSICRKSIDCVISKSRFKYT